MAYNVSDFHGTEEGFAMKRSRRWPTPPPIDESVPGFDPKKLYEAEIIVLISEKEKAGKLTAPMGEFIVHSELARAELARLAALERAAADAAK